MVSGSLITTEVLTLTESSDGHLPCHTCIRYEYTCQYSPESGQATAQAAEPGVEPLAVQPAPAEIEPPSSRARQSPRFHHWGMLDPLKQRFVRANSAIAFPRLLGTEFGSGPVPRLHSFAWNLGLRPEPEHAPFDITAVILWDDLMPLVDTYFRLVHPCFPILDRDSFDQEVSNRWTAGPLTADIDPVILGVVALGSFFSSISGGHAQEMEWVQHAKLLLESKFRSPSVTDIAAWILRKSCFGFFISLDGWSYELQYTVHEPLTTQDCLVFCVPCKRSDTNPVNYQGTLYLRSTTR